MGQGGSIEETDSTVSAVENPWDNVYWFSRMLINADQYGAVGSDARVMQSIIAGIRDSLGETEGRPGEEAAAAVASRVGDVLEHRWMGKKRESAVKALAVDLRNMLLSRDDVEALLLACERVVVPIGAALKRIPNDDRVFAESIGRSLLRSKGESALASLINVWDELGWKGSMAAERVQVANEFGQLRVYLRSLKLNPGDEDVILSGFCQEFERRLGQKRKGRAGRGVESVTEVILDHFGIAATSTGPEHFTTGLEIDRWVRTKDKWYIGVSCKRTLRERWKQAYTTDLDTLNRHKIKSIWHLVTFDRDLSDDKITEIGSHRAVLYLPDDSDRYASASVHPGMETYVRPISAFISDLRKETH